MIKLLGRRVSALLCAAAALTSTAFAEPTNAASALAGWSDIDITPPLGIALGGRGGAMTLAKQVLDPLFAQTLLLQDANGIRFVLVSLDLVGLPPDLSDQMRLSIARELGVEFNLVVLNCSHTHSGPHMLRGMIAGAPPPPRIEADYFNTLAEKIIASARAAEQRLQPATVEVFSGASDVGINRRGINQRGERSILPDPDGPIDERVWVMKVQPANGGAPAIVFSYACHPVIVYGYAYAALSPDFPGAARSLLREKLGGGVHAQFVQGLAGNVRPRVVADLGTMRFRAAQPEDTVQAGSDLADAVLAALKSGGEKLSLKLAGAQDNPLMPRDDPPPREFYENLLKAENQAEYLRDAARYWLKRYDEGASFPKAEPWPAGLVRLAGNQWICLLAGEPCVEWRGKIEAWLAPRNVVTWGYSQQGLAYLPTEELLPQGGYEVVQSNRARASSPAPFARGIHEAMRRSLLRQLRFIEADESP